jgi:hypothetical protein
MNSARRHSLDKRFSFGHPTPARYSKTRASSSERMGLGCWQTNHLLFFPFSKPTKYATAMANKTAAIRRSSLMFSAKFVCIPVLYVMPSGLVFPIRRLRHSEL